VAKYTPEISSYFRSIGLKCELNFRKSIIYINFNRQFNEALHELIKPFGYWDGQKYTNTRSWIIKFKDVAALTSVLSSCQNAERVANGFKAAERAKQAARDQERTKQAAADRAQKAEYDRVHQDRKEQEQAERERIRAERAAIAQAKFKTDVANKVVGTEYIRTRSEYSIVYVVGDVIEHMGVMWCCVGSKYAGREYGYDGDSMYDYTFILMSDAEIEAHKQDIRDAITKVNEKKQVEKAAENLIGLIRANEIPSTEMQNPSLIYSDTFCKIWTNDNIISYAIYASDYTAGEGFAALTDEMRALIQTITKPKIK